VKRAEQPINLTDLRDSEDLKLEVPPDFSVGIIMDGNRRWARKRGAFSYLGHVAGVERARKIAMKACEIGVKRLVLYAFSLENWRRSSLEVKFIFSQLRKVFERFLLDFVKRGIWVRHLGELIGLPIELVGLIKAAEKKRPSSVKMQLFLAFNYSSRVEIMKAVLDKTSKISDILREADAKQDVLLLKKAERIVEEKLMVPKLDLLIRTGGMKRLSGFMLWQSAYAEIYFTERPWYEFSEEEFEQALIWFSRQKRNFGG